MITDGKKIVYVTREIERALGIEPNPDYQIVSNRTKYGESLKAKYPEYIHLVDAPSGKLLGTGELMDSPLAKNLITKDHSVLVFKNTLRVEAVIKANGWKFLNPPAVLSERVENKLTQLRWLGHLGNEYLPPHGAKLAKFITWKSNEPFVVQWAHGHTGDGTIIVRTPEDLRSIQEKFPERMARITSFVEGPSFTVNAVVSKDKVLMGNISYQITGLQPFTDNEFSTIGNDWGAAKKMLGQAEIEYIKKMVETIGNRLRGDGWTGLFGVDLIRDEKRNKIYLIEINARQPASSSFESELEEKERKNGASGMTTFEAHIAALLGLPCEEIISINDGAQIVQRVTKNVQSLFDDLSESLSKSGFKTVSYENAAPNSDLLRVQSERSIMDSHKTFADSGRKIAESIKSAHFNLEV